MPFATTYQRCQQADFFCFKPGKNIFNNFLFTEFHHLLTGVITVCLPYPRKQKPHKIIHLCNSANGRPGVFVSGFLFNGNYR